MNFGEWVKQIRNQRDLDVREFARLVGVDSSTISRTENSQTQPTVYTAFRICQAFSISMKEMLDIIDIPERSHQLPLFDDSILLSMEEGDFKRNQNVLTIDEVKSLIDDFIKHKNSISGFLVEGLNEILHWSYHRSPAARAYLDHRIGQYTVNDIDLIVFRSPLSYRLELRYPSVSPRVFEYTYRGQGAIMLHDIERYLDINRVRGRGRLSTFSLSRIGTGSAIERIKLYDVLEFSSDLKQSEEILGMYWEAARFYSTFLRYDSKQSYSFDDFDGDDWEIRLAVAYVTIYRWYQVLKGEDYTWKYLKSQGTD